MNTMSGALYDIIQMRVPKAEVVIYDTSGGVSRYPLWSSALIRLLCTTKRTWSPVSHALWVVRIVLCLGRNMKCCRSQKLRIIYHLHFCLCI